MAADMMDILERSKAYYEQYLADLEAIVNIDSGTFDKQGVDKAGKYLRSLLESLGGSSEMYPNDELGDNFVTRILGNGSRRLMLLGHFDTVYATGTVAERPFRIDDNKAYGPAAIDMKGGLMYGYYALRILKDLGYDDFAEIVFVANSDEEVGSPSSRKLIEDIAREMDVVFCLEPGKSAGGVLTERKGVGMFQIEVQGVAAHAGAAPQDGRNANLEMAHKIVELHELNDIEAGTTVAANVLRGGERRNVIAAHATLEIDVRVPNAVEAERITSAIEAIADKQWVPDTKTILTGGINRPPMEKVSGTDTLVEVSRRIVSDVGLEFKEWHSGGGSDGNFTAAIGTPTLDALGPLGFNAHRPDEHADLESLAQRLALVTGLLIEAPARPRG